MPGLGLLGPPHENLPFIHQCRRWDARAVFKLPVPAETVTVNGLERRHGCQPVALINS